MNEHGIRQLGAWLSKFTLFRHQKGSDKMSKDANYYCDKDFQIFLHCNWMGKKNPTTIKTTNKKTPTNHIMSFL